VGDSTSLLDKDGNVHNVAVDVLTTRDGGAATEEVTLVKNGWGAENTFTSPAVASPSPIRDYGYGTAITGAGGQAGTDSFTTSQTLVTANANRGLLIVSNGGTVGVWLTFAATTAVVNRGVYLPPSSNESFPYRGEVRVIPATGAGGPVSYVEF
jgi:hypothetical protein